MIEKDTGFILKRHDFRETSIIAALYTRRFGKINGIFKGFYTNKKEYSTPLDIFSLNEFVFYPKNNEIWLVSHADLIRDYGFLRKDVEASRVAGIFLSIMDKSMALWDTNSQIFDLLQEALGALDKERSVKLFCIFLIKFLALSGFKPEFNHCIICGCDLGSRLHFSNSRGGLLCPACGRKTHDSRTVSIQVSKSILYIQNNRFPEVLRLNLSRKSAREIYYLLKDFFNYHFDLKGIDFSLDFLEDGPESCVPAQYV